jgi:hypothetical protein
MSYLHPQLRFKLIAKKYGQIAGFFFFPIAALFDIGHPSVRYKLAVQYP